MGRHRERGHAALWVIGSLVVSIAAGVGVYLAIKEQRIAAAAEATAEPPPQPPPSPPRSEPPAPADPVPPQPVPEPASVPPDRAEAGAVDPTSGMFGTPGIDGALDTIVVVQAMKSTEAKLTKCFDPASGGGVVRVMLMLNRRGGVTTVAASGVDDALDRCVENVLRPLRFGRTADGNPAKIVYPIAFRGAEGDGAGTPPTTTPSAGDDGACDEVACVLENYESPCCAKFKPLSEATTPEAPTREELVQGFRSLGDKVRACAADAGFTGALRLKVAVKPDGSVGAASLGDAEPALARCVTSAARKIKLSPSRNGVTATFPYNVQ